MKQIIIIAILICLFSCTKVTTQEVTINNDLKPITANITVGNNTSNTVAVK
jgi:hypothetical protein